MPTLDDLQRAFGELERQAPATLSGPIRPAHHHRWLAAGLAAACTAAVAVSVPLVLSGGHGGRATEPSLPATSRLPSAAAFPAALPAPAAGQSPVLAYGFATGPAAGLAVTPDQVTATYQHATIGADDPNGGQLFVFYADAYDPTQAEQGTPVAVGDRPGYYTQVPLADAGTADALVWEYADDGWAAVSMNGAADPGAAAARKGATPRERARADAEAAAQAAHDEQLELTIAENTHAASTPLTSPVRVPASSGLHVASLAALTANGGLDLATGNADTWYLGWSPFTLRASDKPASTTTTIGDREWVVYQADGVPTSLGLVADGWGMTITPGHSATLAEMEQFAASLQFAPDLADQSTWFDAADALP